MLHHISFVALPLLSGAILSTFALFINALGVFKTQDASILIKAPVKSEARSLRDYRRNFVHHYMDERF